MTVDKGAASPINLTTPTLGIGGFLTCPKCGALAVIKDGSVVAVRFTFSRCISPESRAAAASDDIARRRDAITACSTFNQVIMTPRVSGFLDGLQERLARRGDRLLELLRVPPNLRGTIRYLIVSWITQNPFLVLWLLSGVYSVVAATFGAAIATGLFVGKGIVVLIPVTVHWLKGSIDGNLPGQLLFIACLAATAEVWVRVSSWNPFIFGLIELSMGLGMAFFGFRDPQNEFAAFFALVGGAFTVIDGRQRMNEGRVTARI